MFIKPHCRVLTALLVLFNLSFPGSSLGAKSIKYEFSALFTPKTCSIVTPDTIVFESSKGSGRTSVKSIQDDEVSQDFIIRLTACSDPELSGSSVYLANGRTLQGSNQFFNDDATGNFGVQLYDKTKVLSLNTFGKYPPDVAAVAWSDISHESQTKTLTAKLRCQVKGCVPKEGPFSAMVVLNFYSY